MTDLKTKILTALKCKEKNLQARLAGLKLADTCTRCGGGGHYSYNQMYGTTCFKCHGSGYQDTKPTKALLAKCEAVAASGELDAYIQNMIDAAKAKALVKNWNDEFFAVWGSHPDVKPWDKVHFTKCPPEHHAANKFACGLMDSVKNDEREIQWGIFVPDSPKSHRGTSRKLTHQELIERSGRLVDALNKLKAWVAAANAAATAEQAASESPVELVAV